jgi:hypothetical protein
VGPRWSSGLREMDLPTDDVDPPRSIYSAALGRGVCMHDVSVTSAGGWNVREPRMVQ